MKEKIIHREAFEYYFELGDDRTLKSVADRFGIAVRSVEKWSSAFNWQEKVFLRDRAISEAVEKKLIKTVVDEKIKYKKIADNYINRVILGLGLINEKDEEKRKKILANGGIEITPKTIWDLERLINLNLKLLGEASDKFKIEGSGALTIKELVERANNRNK